MYTLRTKISSLVSMIILCAILVSGLGSIHSVEAAPIAKISPQAQATEGPRVVSVTPEGGFLKEREGIVTITFSQPMDRARTEASFSIQPAIPGEFEWSDSTNLKIRFSEPFSPGIQYILTLSRDQAMDTSGHPIWEDYRWYYWLDPFEIRVSVPSSRTVVMHFSAPINQGKKKASFEIQPVLKGKWKWQDPRTAFFESVEPIPLGVQFSIRIKGPLSDQYGELSYDDSALTFTALPPIQSVTPTANDRVRPDLDRIKIVFDREVDQASAQKAFRVSPFIDGYFMWDRSGGSTFDNILSYKPRTLFEKGQQYTVSLSTDLKDPAGRPLMVSAYSWNFVVDSYYYGSSQASFGEEGMNVQVVDVDGLRRIQFAGKDTIQFELYRYDLIDFARLYSQNGHQGYDFSNIALPEPEENRLAASWFDTDKGAKGIRETTIPPEVSSGLYVVNLKRAGRSFSQLFLILARNTVVAKLSGDQVYVWVTDINGDAVPKAEIRLYSDRGEKIGTGETDQQGAYRMMIPDGYTPMLVSARVQTKEYSDVTLTGLTGGWGTSTHYYGPENNPAKHLVYTYTDRPIYKPGQIVLFKSIVRHDRDVKYSLLPAGTPVKVNVRDPKNNLIHSLDLSLNDFGTVDGSFTVSEGAALGSYRIEVIVDHQSSDQVFQVEDYRKPDFRVMISPGSPNQNNQYLAGDKIELNVDVRYYFEEPVANAKLTAKIYSLHGYYDWWNQDQEDVSYFWYPIAAGTKGVQSAITDADGKAQITIPISENQKFEYGYYSDWRSSYKSMTFAVEVTADDGSNQTVSAHYIYKVANAIEVLSLDSLGYYKEPGIPFTVQASVMDLLNQPVEGRTLTLELQKWSGQAKDYVSIKESYTLVTKSDGQASQSLSLEAGYYKLILVGTDPLGNKVSYEHWLGVFSGRSNWDRQTDSEIEISAEQEEYKPYQTARFVIESSFSGPALLTFERGTVIHTKQVTLTAPLTIVEAEIIPEDAPNVFVTINVWRPTIRNEDSLDSYYSNIPDSRLLMARTELLVEAESKALEVSIHADQKVYEPGAPITVEIEVTNHEGEPVLAEVSLALVDEAIFGLSNELSPNIFSAFYGPRRLSVSTYDSMSPYRYIYAGGRGGGGGDGLPPEPRSDFPDTAAWYPTLHTDINGKATVTFPLPDNITSWRLSAKAITKSHQVGEGRINVDVKKSLVLRPILPRVLTTGDQAELAVMVHNYGTTVRTVQVVFKGDQINLQDDAVQTITIPAGASKMAGWSVIPTGTTETQVQFFAMANDGASDAVQLAMPVRPLAILDTQSITGSFSDDETLDLVIPPDILEDNSLVTLSLGLTPASGLLDGLEFLTGYPYGCVEQTMSRAMPNAVLGRASFQLGFGGEEFRKQVDPLIAASIQKLYGFQHYDGGWGWWLDDDSTAYQTAWVLHGLAVIRSAGYDIDPGVIEGAVNYLEDNLESLDVKTRAYALYSMALAGNGDLSAAQSLANSSLRELDPFSQAALALSLYEMGDATRAEAILALLADSAVRKGNHVYWPQASMDGEYHRKTMASTIRTTAFVLSAILKIGGSEHPLVIPVADYLISKRNGHGWGTTNETSFTILALTDYLSGQINQAGRSEFKVNLNGSPFSSGMLEPGQMFYHIEIPFSQLRVGKNNVTLEGSGGDPIYYDLVGRFSLSRANIGKAGSIDITRQYLDPKTKEALEKIEEGQLVLVQLTVKMPENGSFILIEDHLPAGLEALNERLNATGHEYEDYYDSTPYYWREYGYNNKEIRGDRVCLFVTELSKGISIFSYLARATTSGTFTALPVDVSAMYDPLMWGRSADAILTVWK